MQVGNHANTDKAVRGTLNTPDESQGIVSTDLRHCPPMEELHGTCGPEMSEKTVVPICEFM